MERQNKGKTYTGNGKQGGFSKEKSFGNKGAKSFGDSPRGRGDAKVRPYAPKEQGDRPYSAKPKGDYEKRSEGDRPYSPRPKGDYEKRSEGDRPYSPRPKGSYEKRSEGDRPYSPRPKGSYEKRSEGDRPYSAKSKGSYEKRSEGDRPYSPRPKGSYEKRSEGERPYSAKPKGGYEKRSEGDRPYNAKPKRNYDNHSETERPYNNKPQRSYDNGQAEEQREDIVAGRNPVIELLKSETPVDCIYMQQTESKSGAILKIMSMARDKGLVIKEVTKEKLDSLAPGINHQGAVAVVAAYQFATVEEIIARAGDEKLFVVIADEIEDPHNLGAIIRTADAAGAHGVIIPKRRGAGLTSAVMRASAGAASHVAVAKVPNLVQVIDQLKEMGVWIYAADMDGSPWCGVDYNGAVALVVGSEGKGVSRLVKEHCDVVVSLPMQGKINSLNASVAAGIILYEVARQRQGLGRK